MNAYPNPITQGHVLARITTAATKSYDLDLTDAGGVTVRSFRFDLEAGAHELFLDLPDLTVGCSSCGGVVRLDRALRWA